MKAEQQKQAESLYFQTDLTKSEIAQLIGVSRRSLHYWVRDNNWDRLKKNAQNMPSHLAENCYHIMANLQHSILSDGRATKPITHQEVNTLYKLTLTIGKLKDRGALNENLEMMAYFMEHVGKQYPAMTGMLQPIVNDYIKSRAAVQPAQFVPAKFNTQSNLPIEEDAAEAQLDLEDVRAWDELAAQSAGAPQPVGPVELEKEILFAGASVSQATNEKISGSTTPEDQKAKFMHPANLLKGKANNRAARRQMARAAA